MFRAAPRNSRDNSVRMTPRFVKSTPKYPRVRWATPTGYASFSASTTSIVMGRCRRTSFCRRFWATTSRFHATNASSWFKLQTRKIVALFRMRSLSLPASLHPSLSVCVCACAAPPLYVRAGAFAHMCGPISAWVIVWCVGEGTNKSSHLRSEHVAMT